jgi:formylmethanofuran dehydrogenase subunit C
MFKLTLRTATALPLEVEGILPERVAGLSALEVAKLPILHGNRHEPLGEHFAIGSTKVADIQFTGETGQIKRIGAGISSGTILVDDGAGMHAGAQMTGGMLFILGNAGDWCGAEMRGGSIEIRGNAGNQLGAAYRGSRHGMRGGTIIVRGDAGDEAGLLMRRGLIAVQGTLGQFAGASMIAGTIVALGGVGPHCGAGMKRGTIIAGCEAPALPTSFHYSCEFESSWLAMFRKQVEETVFPIPAGSVQCYRGDALTGGRGEILFLSNARRCDSSSV